MVPPASWSPRWRLLAALTALAALLPLMLALPAAAPDDGVVEEAERSGPYGSAAQTAARELMQRWAWRYGLLASPPPMAPELLMSTPDAPHLQARDHCRPQSHLQS
eukprot:SM000127S26630  [mRNA]  locus=s127:153155:153472:+ [translate_table: standard]